MCGISVVDLVAGNLQTSLHTTWVERPFPAAALASFLEGPSARKDIEDVDEAWNPLSGSTVFRAYAAPPRLPVSAVIDTQSSFGSWGTMSAPVSLPAEFTRISLLSHQGQLRACTVSSTGKIAQATLSVDGLPGWSGGEMPGSGNLGNFVDVACAGEEAPGPPAAADQHVCAVTNDGKLLHAILSLPLPSGDGSKPPQTFSPFGDVKAVVGDIGRVFRVDCAVDGRQLHLVALAERGGRHSVWHTSRIPSGAWSPWENVLAETIGPLGGVITSENIRDVAAGMCDNDGPAAPAGEAETRRLNIAWVENQSLTVVIRSKRVLAWRSLYPASRYSPRVTVGAPQGLPDEALTSVSVQQRPFQPSLP